MFAGFETNLFLLGLVIFERIEDHWKSKHLKIKIAINNNLKTLQVKAKFPHSVFPCVYCFVFLLLLITNKVSSLKMHSSIGCRKVALLMQKIYVFEHNGLKSLN